MTSTSRQFAAGAASLVLCLAAASRGQAADYFLDALSGSDHSDGLSATTAWASLKRASEFDYAPGDRLLLKAGQSFRGSLLLKGSGTKESPIVLGSFGEGPRPRIEGDGHSDFSRAGVKAISCAVCPSIRSIGESLTWRSRTTTRTRRTASPWRDGRSETSSSTSRS